MKWTLGRRRALNAAWAQAGRGDWAGAIAALDAIPDGRHDVERAGLRGLCQLELGPSDEAIAATIAAADAFQHINPKTAALMRGAAASALVVTWDRVGEALEQASLGSALGVPAHQARLASIAAGAAAAIGRAPEAETWARRAIHAARADGDWDEEVYAIQRLADALGMRNRVSELRVLFSDLLDRAVARGDDHAAVHARLGLVVAHAGFADFEYAAREWAVARDAIAASPDVEQLLVLLELAFHYPDLTPDGPPDDAVPTLRHTLAALREDGRDNILAYRAAMVLAMALVADGNAAEAREVLRPELDRMGEAHAYSRAAAILRLVAAMDFDDPAVDGLLDDFARSADRSSNLSLRVIAGVSRGLRALLDERWADAVTHLEAAARAIDEGATTMTPGRQATRRSDLIHEAHATLAVARARLGDHAGALEALEAGRARLALDALLAEPADDAPVDAPTARLRAIHAERAELYAQLADPGIADDPPAREARHARLHELASDLQRLDDEQFRHAPARAALRRPDGLDARQLQQALAVAGAVAIEYAVWAGGVLGVCVTGDEILAVPVTDDLEALEHEIGCFLEDIEALALHPRYAVSLYQTLLMPFKRLLAGVGRLLIVPDGPLHGLPFDALQVLPGYEGAPWAERHLVLHRHLTSLAPSIQVACLLQGRAAGPHLDWSIVAAAPDDDRLRPALPGAANEATVIAGAIGRAGGGTSSLTGSRATRAAVEQLSGRRADVLHIASHATAHPDDPELSAIHLVPEAGEPGPDAGAWRAFEIARHRTGHRTVILSACETAKGPSSGEGVLALSRAFLHAGAQSVLATHWEIGDDDARALMDRLHEELFASDASPAAALRATKRWALTQPGLDAPVVWGAFAAVGAL